MQRASGVVEELTNTADITINAKLTAMRTIYLGGVIANTETADTDPTFIKTSAGVATNVQSCSNTGALKIVKSGAFQMKGGAIGGIAASVNSGTSISDCLIIVKILVILLSMNQKHILKIPVLWERMV